MKIQERKFRLNDIMGLFEKLLRTLENKNQISLIDFEKFKLFRLFIEGIEIQNDELSEEVVILQEIKKMRESILSIVKGKKEYQFIYDYFGGNRETFGNISGVSNFSSKRFHKGMGMSVEMQNIVENEKEGEGLFEEESLNDKNYESFIKVIDTLSRYDSSVDNQKSIFDLLPLTSNEFLKNKIKLDEEEIIQLKGKEIEEECPTEQIIKEAEETKISSPPKKFLEIIQSSSVGRKETASIFLTQDKNKAPSKEITSIEKEMDEEINNEIFNYTRNMKHYARSFNEILHKDNRKLDTIENNQDTGKTKTDRSMRSLKEFSSSIRIGFFKLILMLLVVGAAFVLTLLTIRIFPKLA